MLVLTRQVGEEIVIGGNIRVKVVSANHKTASIGITAPPSIRVDRQEIHLRRKPVVRGESDNGHAHKRCLASPLS
jgi:carbon storage regulator CsrA